MDSIKAAAIRALRTFAQAFLAIYLAGVSANITGIEGFADITLINNALAAGGAAVLALLQNWLENSRQVSYQRG